MMKPIFDDVIEYVKAGEDDPEMAEMLQLHPDGQELLKQARFICKVLQHQAESGVGGDGVADLDDVAGGRSFLSAEDSADSVRERSASLVSYQEQPFRPRKKRPRSISNRIKRDDRRSEDLGTLEFAVEGENISLSYEPSPNVRVRFKDPAFKIDLPRVDIKGIEIRGRGITLSLSDTLPAAEPMSIRVTSGARQMPTWGLEFIFMPETGPFVRIRADEDGLVQLPVPGQPGTLRIETPEPQFLRIKPKNSH